MTADSSGQFLYVYSCDLNEKVQVKIGSLEGKFEKPTPDALQVDPSLQYCVSSRRAGDGTNKDMFITCTIYCDGHPIGLPVYTSYKCFHTRWNWNEWLTLPGKYSELSRNAQLALSVWDFHDDIEPHCVGGTTVTLFSKRGLFRTGIIDLKVWPFKQADGNNPTTTPGKIRSDNDDGQSEMRRLSKLAKKHRTGLVEKVDWLDRLTFREIETINEREKRRTRSLYLMVEFVRVHFDGIDHSIVYFEKNGDLLYRHRKQSTLVRLFDSDVDRENLLELKQHIMTRGSAVDSKLQPSGTIKDALERAVHAPSGGVLSAEQRDLLWRFRFHLRADRKALAKFLRSVDWSEPREVKEAGQLLVEWTPIDAQDALELLSPHFTQSMVRRYAVSRLASATQEELLLYLPQLVQALKYEHRSGFDSATDVSFRTESSVVSTEHAESIADEAQLDDSLDLASFLIKSACKYPVLTNYLYWYLKVEVDSCKMRENAPSAMTSSTLSRKGVLYSSMLQRLIRALVAGDVDSRQRAGMIEQQQILVDRLVCIMKEVTRESGNRKRKTEFLKTRLAAVDDSSIDLTRLNGLILPVDPSIRVEALLPDRASVFNSSLMPCKLTFRTVDGHHYVAMFKRGDDLRQDQLVMQMIGLMDRLLKSENLDLRLTPYRVLATSINDGFVQFIDAVPLRDVIAEWGGVLEMFRFYRPSSSGVQGIEPDVLDNYIRSCAGYSVICYLLGVGDRHQHNLLLCRNGRLFHVDFGYMLGRDPKPLPPPMKLTTEMMTAMGGTEGIVEFRRLCYTAFLHLRRHADVVLSLFSLMLDADIPDIALEPDKAVRKIEERFHLHLNDEQAVQHMQYLIDSSTSAKMPLFVDWMHDVKQMMNN